MDMDIALLSKSMTFGFAIAAPVGPIGLLCLRRSLTLGMRAGFSSGLGAACADFLYGLLAAFGVGALAAAIQSAGPALAFGGGLVLIWIGWKAAREHLGEQSGLANAGFAGTFLLTVTNPATILSFGAIMSGLGAHNEPGTVALGVFLGSAAWWLCLSAGGAMLRHRVQPVHLRWINRLSGAMVMLMGARQLAPEAWAGALAFFTYLSNQPMVS